PCGQRVALHLYAIVMLARARVFVVADHDSRAVVGEQVDPAAHKQREAAIFEPQEKGRLAPRSWRAGALHEFGARYVARQVAHQSAPLARSYPAAGRVEIDEACNLCFALARRNPRRELL